MKRRWLEHKNCKNTYTKRFKGNIILVYLEEIVDRNLKVERKRAMRRELQMKKWSRKRVEMIIKLRRDKINELLRKYMNIE